MPTKDFSKISISCKLRSDEGIEQQAIVFEQMNGNQLKGKELAELYRETKSIRHYPLIKIDFDNIVPPPSHIIQGLGDYLIDKLEEEADDVTQCLIQEFLESIGVTRQAFGIRTFTGNNIRKILLKVDQIKTFFDGTDRAEHIIKALTKLGEIQGLMKAGFLTDQEINLLEESVVSLGQLVSNHLPELHNLPKLHLLLAHVVPFAKKHHFYGMFSEQGIESLHAVFNSSAEKWKRMKTADQLKELLKQNILKNYLFDCGKE